VRQYEKPVEINHDRIVCAHFDCVWKNGWLVLLQILKLILKPRLQVH